MSPARVANASTARLTLACVTSAFDAFDMESTRRTASETSGSVPGSIPKRSGACCVAGTLGVADASEESHRGCWPIVPTGAIAAVDGK